MGAIWLVRNQGAAMKRRARADPGRDSRRCLHRHSAAYAVTDDTRLGFSVNCRQAIQKIDERNNILGHAIVG